jgi:hypothetical protein
MNNNELLKCSIAVLNFLLVGDDEFDELKDFNVPSNESMIKTLKKFNLNMVSFTELLNVKFNIYNELWKDSPKEFFSNSDVSIDFYKVAINSILTKIMYYA